MNWGMTCWDDTVGDMLSSQSSMDLLYAFFNKMNREHAVIWCARLERLTWEDFKRDSAVPGDATVACKIASIHPLSCNHSPIIFRQHISMWRPPSMVTKCSSPCVSGQHHWTCFAVERLIQVTMGTCAGLSSFTATRITFKAWRIMAMDLESSGNIDNIENLAGNYSRACCCSTR